jgi:hypothetical protein
MRRLSNLFSGVGWAIVIALGCSGIFLLAYAWMVVVDG